VENPQNPVRKSAKHITNQKEFYHTKPKTKIHQKKQPKTKTLYEEDLVFGSRVGWGLEFGNTKLSNSGTRGYSGCNTRAWFDEANAAWLTSNPFNKDAFGEVLRLQGREDFI
jgi:hypothetical protein